MSPFIFTVLVPQMVLALLILYPPLRFASPHLLSTLLHTYHSRPYPTHSKQLRRLPRARVALARPRPPASRSPSTALALATHLPTHHHHTTHAPTHQPTHTPTQPRTRPPTYPPVHPPTQPRTQESTQHTAHSHPPPTHSLSFSTRPPLHSTHHSTPTASLTTNHSRSSPLLCPIHHHSTPDTAPTSDVPPQTLMFFSPLHQFPPSCHFYYQPLFFKPCIFRITAIQLRELSYQVCHLPPVDLSSTIRKRGSIFGLVDHASLLASLIT